MDPCELEIRETENALHRRGLQGAGVVYIIVLLAATAPNGDLAYQWLILNLKYQKGRAGHSSCSSGFRATDEFVHSPHCSKRQRANVSRIKLIIWFVNALFGNIMLCWPSLPKEYHLYNTLICQRINKIMLTLSIVVWETNPQKIATYRAGKQTPNTNVKISPSWGKWNHSWTDRFTQ